MRKALAPSFRLILAALPVIMLISVGVEAKVKSKTKHESKLTAESGASVWVTRDDGGKQCAPETAEPLDKGASELSKAKIRVIESHKGRDGKLRAQVCGAPSGSENAYRILKSDLPQAVVLGFKEAATIKEPNSKE